MKYHFLYIVERINKQRKPHNICIILLFIFYYFLYNDLLICFAMSCFKEG